MNDALRRVRRWARVAFVSAALVVLAGAVVRTTGSGMGCPDWPKCFGLVVPPTRMEEVRWSSDTAYPAGRMVIESDTLWVAAEDHVSGASGFSADRARWTAYTVHSYTHFAPHHTWIEFINRLLGAWTGVPALALVVFSGLLGLRYRKWRPFAAAAVGLVLLLFVAWLGKLVVDGNLVPYVITQHMVGAVGILAAFAAALSAATPVSDRESAAPLRAARGRWTAWVAVAVVAATAQLLMGTQVREAIDSVAATGVERSGWIEALPAWWKGHRTASWAVLALHAVWLIPALRLSPGVRWSVPGAVVAVLLVQMLTGVLFVYAGMPSWAQPLHLLLGVLLVACDVWMLLRVRALPA